MCGTHFSAFLDRTSQNDNVNSPKFRLCTYDNVNIQQWTIHWVRSHLRETQRDTGVDSTLVSTLWCFESIGQHWTIELDFNTSVNSLMRPQPLSIFRLKPFVPNYPSSYRIVRTYCNNVNKLGWLRDIYDGDRFISEWRFRWCCRCPCLIGSLSTDDGYGYGNATKQEYDWLKKEK